MKYIWIIAASGLLASCSSVPLGFPNDRIWLLSPQTGPDALEQCSRSEPAKGQSYFVPGRADITKFEKLLQYRLASEGYFDRTSHWRERNNLGPVASLSDKNGWIGELIGIVRDEKRYIYGSYFPALMREQIVVDNDKGDHDFPLKMCDGGDIYFGAEYDIAADQLTRLDFDGAGP